jgi:CTP:molybdopterin cytidylyltransferase MocA
MTSRTRDRHQRGLRGPLALANPLTGRPVQPARPASRTAYFTDTVQSAVDQIAQHCPDALVGVTFGIEDVPYLNTAWSGDQVPLAAALEGDRGLGSLFPPGAAGVALIDVAGRNPDVDTPDDLTTLEGSWS